MRLRNNFGQLP